MDKVSEAWWAELDSLESGIWRAYEDGESDDTWADLDGRANPW